MDARDRERILAWVATLDEATYYELLGVLEIADEPALRRAFHEFSGAFHPDAHPHCDAHISASLRRIFQRGAEAYRVLVNPELRAEYDLALARGHLRLGVPSTPPAGQSVAQSLDDLCASPSAKLHAREADRLISRGELVLARRELLLALRNDEAPHPELAERLAGLDMAIFASGS